MHVPLGQFSCLPMSKRSLHKELLGGTQNSCCFMWCEEGSHPRCLTLIMQTSPSPAIWWSRKHWCVLWDRCKIFRGIKISPKAKKFFQFPKLTSWKWWVEHACVILQALIHEVFLIFYVQHMNLPSSATRTMLPWASSSEAIMKSSNISLAAMSLNWEISLLMHHHEYTITLRLPLSRCEIYKQRAFGEHCG